MISTVVVSGGGLVHDLLVLLVIGIVLWLLHYLVEKSPIPPPFKEVLKWVLIIVGVLVLINFLLGLIGYPIVVFR